MKYEKRPVVIDAIQYTGDNYEEIIVFTMGNAIYDIKDTVLRIKTLEGEMTVNKGDFIIKGVKGEFYPCKPDIFEITYTAVSETQDLTKKAVSQMNKAELQTYIKILDRKLRIMEKEFVRLEKYKKAITPLKEIFEEMLEVHVDNDHY